MGGIRCKSPLEADPMGILIADQVQKAAEGWVMLLIWVVKCGYVGIRKGLKGEGGDGETFAEYDGVKTNGRWAILESRAYIPILV
jgi:hypothetical protein